jgi:hypothetical protein
MQNHERDTDREQACSDSPRHLLPRINRCRWCMALSLFAGNAVFVSVPTDVRFVEGIVEDRHLSERAQLARDHVAGHADFGNTTWVDRVKFAAVREDDDR